MPKYKIGDVITTLPGDLMYCKHFYEIVDFNPHSGYTLKTYQTNEIYTPGIIKEAAKYYGYECSINYIETGYKTLSNAERILFETRKTKI